MSNPATQVSQPATQLGNVGTWQPWDPSSLGQAVPRVGQAPMLPGNMVPNAPGLTGAEAMANVTGPQMTPTGFGEAAGTPGWQLPAPNMSTPSGPAFGGTGPSLPSTPSSGASKGGLSATESKWLKAGSKGLSKFGQESGGDQQQQAAPAGIPGRQAPAPNPYVSPFSSDQSAYAKSVMQDYLSGGGYG